MPGVQLARRLDHRVAVAAPAQRGLDALEHGQVAVGARDLGGGDLGLGPLDLAHLAVGELHVGPHAGEVEELVGVDVGHVEVVEAGLDELRGGGRRVARVVPPAEGGHQDRLPQRGPRAPDQIGHHLHGRRPRSRPAGPSAQARRIGPMPTAPAEPPTVATLRPGTEVDAVFACARKDRLTGAVGLRLPGARAARPHRLDPRADLPRRRLPGRPVRARRPGARGRPGGALPRRAAGGGALDRARRGGPRPRRLPADRLPRPGGARRLPRAPGPRGARRRPAPGCCARSWTTTTSASPSAARPARGAATTPTWAG